jgi:hypothetical protein
MPISSVLGSSALLPAGLGFRNLLINADFRINQRGYTSGTSLAVGAYGFDRWKIAGGLNTTLTFTSAPQGQMITISTANGQVRQIIEQANVTPGTYILSWEGTVSGRVYNEGGSSTGYASSPVRVVLDGTANVIVEFTTQPSVTSTLWKPQLERNNQPTPFEQRPIGVELGLCQRYYERISGNTGTSEWANIGSGGWDGSSRFCLTYNYLTIKRVRPSVFSSGSGINCLYHGVAWQAVTGVNSYTEISNRALRINYDCSGTSVQGQSGIAAITTASSYIEISAEL